MNKYFKNWINLNFHQIQCSNGYIFDLEIELLFFGCLAFRSFVILHLLYVFIVLQWLIIGIRVK
jgi:hypothetical protein